MLDVLDQHQPTARTVVSLWASAVSAHLDPAYRTDRLSLARLRRAALISAAVAAPLAADRRPRSATGSGRTSHWHPAAGEPLDIAAFSPPRASWSPLSGEPSTAWTRCGTSRT